MTALPRLAVPDDGSLCAQTLSDLAAAGQVVMVPPDLHALPPDLDADVLVFAAGTAESWRRMAQWRAGGIPVLALATAMGPELLAQSLHYGIDDLLELPVTPEILGHRLVPLARLTTMRQELKRRSATVQVFGVAAPVTAPVTTEGEQAARVLVVAPARFQDDLAARLAGVAQPHWSTDPLDGLSRLHAETFDALVVLPADNLDDTAYLCRQVRSNPRLFNLPALVLAEAGCYPDPVTPYRDGASVVLRPDTDPTLLFYHINALIQRQRQRWRLRSAFNATLSVTVLDKATLVYRRDVFLAHLARLRRHARDSDRPLTVLTIDVVTLNDLIQEHGQAACDAVLRQIGDWITGLIRVEDLAGLLDTGRFAVALPDSDTGDAAIAARRIESVIETTEFVAADICAPLHVRVAVGCHTIDPALDDLALVARLEQAA